MRATGILRALACACVCGLGLHCGGDDDAGAGGGGGADAGDGDASGPGNEGGPGDGGGGGDGGPVLVNDVPLDSTFGTNGSVTLPGDTKNNDIAYAIARQSDGKIVALAWTVDYSDDGIAGQLFVFRVGTNGALDATFGNGGRVLLNAARVTAPRSLLLQPDGKILVGGTQRIDGANGTPQSRGLIVRLDTNGAIDKTFGAGTGMVATGGANGGILGLGPGGAILEARETNNTGGSATAATGIDVARFDASGALDMTFGTSGIASFGLGTYATPAHVDVQSDGKVVVAGTFFPANGVTHQTTILRLLATGAPDTTLDGDGRLDPAPVAKPETHYGGFVLESDGSFLLSGDGYDINLGSTPFIAKYTSSGSLDTSFGTSGVHTDTHGIGELHQLDDGRIMFVGTADSLGRLLSTGAPDMSFGTNGIATPASIASGSTPLIAFAIDPTTGKPWVLDIVDVPSGMTFLRAPEVRAFGADGAADGTFGTSGAAVVPSNDPSDLSSHVVAIPAGGAFVLQRSGGKDAPVLHVWRLAANGAPVTSFGTNGAASIDAKLRSVDGMALSSTGQVLVAGEDAATGRIGILALDPATGAPDTSFGAGGLFTVADTTNTGDVCDLGLDDTGRIVVGTQQGSDGALLRVLANGTADSSFDGDGVLGLTFGTPTKVRVATGAGGKLVAASSTSSGELAVKRVTSTGAMDGSFTATTAQLDDVTVGSVAVLADGSVLVSAYSARAPQSALLVKLTSSLALDATFGTAGVVAVPLPFPPPPAPGVHGPRIVPLAQGKILFTAATVDQLHEVSYVFRFDAAGKLDTSYATMGKGTLVDVGLFGLSPQPDGKMLVSGRAWSMTTGIDAWVARLAL